jgi:flagellar hook-associated protein 2
MTTISNLGVGSGLDLNTLLTSLKNAEQIPLAALQTQQSSYTSKLSAYGKLNSALSALQTAAAALAKPALFQGLKASSTAADVLTATAASTAQAGSFAVNVTQLSQAQSLVAPAPGVAKSTDVIALSASSVKIQFGTISGGLLGTDGKYTNPVGNPVIFTPGATTATPITIAANSTLADIRDAINGSATSGVTASIVNDGSATPNRLVLTSKATGEASSMKITVTGDTALSNLLANDPTATQNLQQTAVAQNTKLTVNGIGITSATNSVVDAVQGVSMTVAKVGATTLSVQDDTASVESAVSTFVSAYNSLQSVAKQLTAFDGASKSGAVLLGDATLRNIQVGIRSALSDEQKGGSSDLKRLSNIGVSFEKDGTLSIDSTKLTAALGSKLKGVEELFAGVQVQDETKLPKVVYLKDRVGGFGPQMGALLTSYTDTTGMLTSATKGVSTTINKLEKDYLAMSERIDTTIARYKAQFTQLDVMMSNMNQTSSYLTQQFDALNNSNK